MTESGSLRDGSYAHRGLLHPTADKRFAHGPTLLYRS